MQIAWAPAAAPLVIDKSPLFEAGFFRLKRRHKVRPESCSLFTLLLTVTL
jgi:hypothetical protein